MLQTNQGRATTATQQTPPSDAELQQQIRQTIHDAQAAALAASKDAAQAARAARAAGSNAQVFAGPLPPIPPGGYTSQPNFNDSIPPQIVDISIAFFIMCAVMVIGWPLARAFGKRIERRGESAAINPAMTEQLQRIEQAVDTMAIEIERISESQRFMARLQNAQMPERALPVERG